MTASNKNLFISFNNVSLRIEERIVFSEASWEFFDDEHWAIIGTNGSGKSLLAKALSGQIPVVRGRIVYHFMKSEPRDRFSDPAASARRMVSYVCFDKQKQALERRGKIYQARWHSSENIDALTVWEYLSEERVYDINPYQVNAWRPDPDMYEANRDRIVKTLAIEKLVNKKVIQLSNGETRKVMLARALLIRPRLLILDSPFTGIDQEYRKRLKAIFQNLMRERLRMVIVTSRPDEILPRITHVMVVENQKITAVGPKEEIIGKTSVGKIWKGFSSSEYNLETPQNQKSYPEHQEGDILVDMKNVNVSYNDVPILCNIDWAIKKGEHWALVGPNGSGKTTLLSLILGDNPQAYANDITLFGRSKGTGESIWEIKQKIGFLSPELHLHFPQKISGFDAVCTGFFDSVGLYRRCSQAQRRMADLWMGKLGLSKYGEDMFEALSDGIQRMILIARALVKQPLLLIMDEPCQGLDGENRHRVLKLVDAIGNKFDVTVVFVTHEIDELPSITTHMLKLEPPNAA